MTRTPPPPPCPRRHRGPYLLAALTAALCLATGAAGAEESAFDYQTIGATLSYSIDISGEAHTGQAGGQWSKASVTRHLQGTLHLPGQKEQAAQVDNLDEQIARTTRTRQAMGTDMASIQRIAEECGDDDDCISARMMAQVRGMSPDKRAAVVQAMQGPAAKFSHHHFGMWGLDGNTACTLKASSRGESSYRSLDQGEGYAEYVTGSEQRQGQGSSDCRHEPVPRASAQWDGDAGTLDLDLPGLAFAEHWQAADGKSGSRQVRIPDVQLDHLRWSGRGPQSGEQVRHITTAAGDDTLPATMTIRWTFTLDRA
jgi:hypothetical protein